MPPTLASKVTNAVLKRIIKWQSRPLDAIYPIVYLDCYDQNPPGQAGHQACSLPLALGVNIKGHKKLLGLWLSENESAKFWLSILTGLQNHEVKDILIAYVDDLKGFTDSIEAISTPPPDTCIQLCISTK